eukprot:2083023-Pleurochrysis_carterae.AAC.4
MPLGWLGGSYAFASCAKVQRLTWMQSLCSLLFCDSQLPLDAFVYMGRIHYIANSDVTWGEHEIDYILFVQVRVC